MGEVVSGFIIGLVAGLTIGFGIIVLSVVCASRMDGLDRYPTKEEWKAGLRRK